MRRSRRVALVTTIAAALLLDIGGCSQPTRPNVLLIVVDALRADHLHGAGFPGPISPALDALAAGGLLFEQHHAHASHTVPSMLSLMLSQLPAEHGFSPPDPVVFATERPVYPERFRFLAEVMRDAGYRTAGFTANPYLRRRNGFDQGFEVYQPSTGHADERVSRYAVEWLEQWSNEGAPPFFLFLHYMNAHQPLDPPEPHRSRFVARSGNQITGNRPLQGEPAEDLVYTKELYAASVAWTDELIGRVLRSLDELGLAGDTLVVVTADHGEEFGEHGNIGHARTIYAETVRVPLLMRFPGRLEAGRRVAHLSQHLDLAPSILQLVGVEAPPEFRGRSVLRPAESVLLETGAWRGVVSGDSKLVRNGKTRAPQLFALGDALDREPRSDAALAQQLGARLDAYEQSRVTPRDDERGAEWSREERERLRALGYAE